MPVVVFGTKSEDLEKQQVKASYFHEQIAGSSAGLGGTIDALTARLGAVENSVQGLSASLIRPPGPQVIDLSKELDDKIAPIASQIEGIKNEVLPSLQQTRTTLDKLSDWAIDNADFLQAAIEARGQIATISGMQSALEKRVVHLETQSTHSRANTIAVASVIVAIASATFGCVSLLIALYVALLR
jgi:hypothetical protein